MMPPACIVQFTWIPSPMYKSVPHTQCTDYVQQTAKPKSDLPSNLPSSLPLTLTDQTQLPHPRQPLAATPAAPQLTPSHTHLLNGMLHLVLQHKWTPSHKHTIYCSLCSTKYCCHMWSKSLSGLLILLQKGMWLSCDYWIMPCDNHMTSDTPWTCLASIFCSFLITSL